MIGASGLRDCTKASNHGLARALFGKWLMALVMAAVLHGCALVRYSQSVRLMEFEQGSHSVSLHHDGLYRGEQQLLFVFKSHDCTQTPKGEVWGQLADRQGLVFAEEKFGFADLAWVQAQRCTPIAFLRNEKGHPLSFFSNDGFLQISVAVSGFEAEEGVSLMIWSAASSLLHPQWAVRE